MVNQAHPCGRFARTRRWLRRGFYAAVALAAVLGCVLYFLTRPQRLAKLAAAALSDMVGAQVHCASADFNLNGLIHLHDVKLDLPHGLSPHGTLFTAGEVVVQHRMLSLLRGQFEAQSLSLFNPTLYLTEDAQSGKFTYQLLKRRAAAGPHSILNHLPDITIQDGRIQFGEIENKLYTELGVIRVGGAMAAQSEIPGDYLFALRQERADHQTGPTISGKFDLVRFTVNARLEGFTLESPQRMILPHRYRQWWDRLDPAGSLSTSFAYDPALGFHLRLQIQNAQITLPYGLLQARMTEVNGVFNVTRDAVDVDHLDGTVKDVHYLIDGRIAGFDADAPFDLKARIAPFTLAADSHNIPALPTGVRKLFNNFQPSGEIQAVMEVRRDKPHGQIAYSGSCLVNHGTGLYYKFRYPLRDVHGQVLFNDERLDVVNLVCHGPAGGTIILNGSVAPPGEGAAVDMAVAATDIPVDHFLYDALEPKHQHVVDLFANQEQYQRLIEVGVIQSSAQAAQRQQELAALQEQSTELARSGPGSPALIDLAKKITALEGQLQRPVFDLGGRVNVNVHVRRPMGAKTKMSSIVDLWPVGGKAVLRHWPYPIDLTNGHIRIDHGDVTIEDVEVRGLTGALGRCSGTVQIVSGPGGITPDVHLTVSQLPVDNLLLASLPKPEDRWLKNLGLEGKLEVSGAVIRNSAGEVDIDLFPKLANGRAQPMGGRYGLEHLTLAAHIQRRQIEITSAEGDHNQTHFNLTGGAHWADKKPEFDLTADATDVNLDDPIFDLLPTGETAGERFRHFIADHHVHGVIDGRLSYHSRPKPWPAGSVNHLNSSGNAVPAGAVEGAAARSAGLAGGNYQLDLHPQWLAFQYHDRPIEMKDITGHMTLDQAGMEFNQFTASLGSGRIVLNGKIDESCQNAQLRVDMRDTSFRGKIADLIPAEVNRTLAGLHFDGEFHLHDGRVIYHAKPAKGENYAEIAGRVEISHGRATASVPVTELEAALDAQVTLAAPGRLPRMDIRLNAPRLKVANRLISPLSVHLVSVAGAPGQLEVTELSGKLYGGSVTGSGHLSLKAGGDYQLTLSLWNVELDPMIHPMMAASAGGKATGVLTADLQIDGLVGDAGSRRGHGRIDVNHGRLYDLPMAMAILQIANLSLPTSRSFDHAAASFVIVGRMLRFDSIKFDAPSVQMAGEGFMNLATHGLDLDFYTRNPTGLDLGPITDMFDMVKDQLISIHVGGTLAEPKVILLPFSVVRKSWESLFGQPNDLDAAEPATQPAVQRSKVGVPTTSDQ